MKLFKTKWLGFMLSLALLLPSVVSAQAANPAATDIVPDTSGDLRITLGQLLGEHTLLDVLGMQKGYDGAPDFANVASLLDDNTKKLTEAVALVYGTDAGKAFQPIWASHIAYMTDYVKATVVNDEAGRSKAVANLDDYRKKQAVFLSSLNPDNFKEPQLEAELQVHINHLLDGFNAYVNKDYAAAYQHAREAYQHMFETGDMLATGIAEQYPEKFSPDGMKLPKAGLRSLLDGLLGEHADLAIIVMQKGYDGKMDFDQAAAALGKNTDDLAAGVATVYGEEAGNAFKTIWSSHIGYLIDYVKATAANNEAGRKAALDNLEKYRSEQAKFFANANPEHFNEAVIADGLKMHIDQLISAFDNYVKKDYSFAYPNFDTAYEHMIKTGDMLVEGISAQKPNLFVTVPDPSTAKSVVIFQLNSSHLNVNGQMLSMDVTPIKKDDFTYIPLRYAAEAIGATVKWDNQNQAVILEWNGGSGTINIGSDEVIINGEKKIVSANNMLQGDRAMVLVSVFSDMTGWRADLADNGSTIRLLAP